jgi:sugar phosphate isomerase/epimerase
MQFKTAARWCAALAAAGVLGSGASAAAQTRAPSTEPGVPTGQVSVQLFNYVTYVVTGQKDANPPTPVPTTTRQRLERVFGFLQSQGVKNAEPFNLFGLTPAEFRALADQYGVNLHARHGDVVEGTWDEQIATAKALGQEYVGSGGVGMPGIGSYANTLATAETLNRLGRRSVEAGVGPIYIHNHQQEFRTKYVDNGVLKSAWEILMERTDPRYVVAELDVLWASDGGYDPVALLNTWGARIPMLHMKDGRNVTAPADATPVPYGTGEIDFTRIINAAKGNVRYFIYEQDPPIDPIFGGPTPASDPFADGAISLPNLKGAPAPVPHALPPAFPAGQRGGTTGAPVPVTVRNRGDAPLTISAVGVEGVAPDAAAASDFAVAGETCTSAPIAPDATCTVSVAFTPARAVTTSLARLRLASNADDATESVMLVARSGNALDVPANVGGTVPATLSLTLAGPASFGAFTPGVSREYTASTTANVISTAADAALTVNDPGHLSNGAFTLPQPLRVGIAPSAWSGPVSNATSTITFTQAIGAGDALRTGTYSRTLTFTLSTTTP